MWGIHPKSRPQNPSLKPLSLSPVSQEVRFSNVIMCRVLKVPIAQNSIEFRLGVCLNRDSGLQQLLLHLNIRCQCLSQVDQFLYDFRVMLGLYWDSENKWKLL